jgi:dihydropteroate synthase
MNGAGERTPTRIGSRVFSWGSRTFIMGIVNLTPDSFSGDGLVGRSRDPVDAAIDQARRMVDEGADLIDIGGESSRPGHDAVTAAEERARVVPAVAAIRLALPNVPISIDTTKGDVAAAALDAGADLINDVWGVRPGGPLVELAARRGVPIALTHNRVRPEYVDVIGEVILDLRAAVDGAQDAGVPLENVIVDPGFGFGKTPAQNLTLLGRLDELRILGRPILLGTSRKSTLGHVMDLPPDERLEATLATTALGIAGGADIVRVHDVLANVRAARMTDAVVRGLPA